MKKTLLVALAAMLSMFVVACGSGGGNPVGGSPIPGVDSPTSPAPTTTPSTPGATPSTGPAIPLKVNPSNFVLITPGAGNMLTIFDIPATPGTLEITLSWSFGDSTLGVYLLSQPGCYPTPGGGWTGSAKDISDGTCPTLVGPVVSLLNSTRTETITRLALPGKSYLHVANERKLSGGEAGHVEVTFRPKPQP